MLRDGLTQQLDHDPNFRWRGKAVTRIENLSDIVFALALGLLVSAGTPPQTYQELFPHLMDIVPVTAGFITMVGIWHAHFTYFRRYGVADGQIIALNAILLLLILFLATPLRFVFDSLFAFILGSMGDWSRMEAMGIASYRQAGVITGWFGLGYALVFGVFHQMYMHALRKADILDLSPIERQMTKRSIWAYRAEVVIASLAGLIAAFTIVGPFAGFLLMLNWPFALIIKRALKLPEADSKAA